MSCDWLRSYNSTPWSECLSHTRRMFSTELRNAVLPSEFFLSRMLSGHLLRSARFTVHKIATDCVPMRRSEPRVTIPKRGIYSSSDSFTLSWYGIRYKQGPLNRIRIELKAFSCRIYGHSLRSRGRSAALATPSYPSPKKSPFDLSFRSLLHFAFPSLVYSPWQTSLK